MLAAFVAIVILLSRLIPSPLRDTDYLVIGTLATFGSLAILFALTLLTGRKHSSTEKKSN